MGARIHVIETDPDVKRLLEYLVESHGYEAVVDGQDGQPDVILCAEPLYTEMGAPVLRFTKPLQIDALLNALARMTGNGTQSATKSSGS